MHVIAETIYLVPGAYVSGRIDTNNKNNSDLQMTIVTNTTINSSNHHQCHPYQTQHQVSATAVATGRLVVVLRKGDDLWYLVTVFFSFFSVDAAAHSHSNVHSKCPPPRPQAGAATTITTSSSDKLLLVLVLRWWRRLFWCLTRRWLLWRSLVYYCNLLPGMPRRWNTSCI